MVKGDGLTSSSVSGSHYENVVEMISGNSSQMGSNPTPEVTVLMTVYNAMPFLEEAIDSILRQSLGDFIFLIIDDGSTDGGGDYLDRLTDTRIRIMHQTNHGQGVARNVGLRICRSEFVAMMDADDIALPSRLQNQVEFLKKHKEVGMVGSQFAYVGANGKTGFPPPMPCDHAEIVADLLRGRLAINQPSLMCRTSILKSIGGYRIAGCGEDWDMFLRMGEVSKLANMDKILHLYRINPGSTIAKNTGLVRARIAHACLCANQRAAGLSEIPFEQFSAERRARPFWSQALDRADWYASNQYRAGLAQILDSRPVEGYARIGWSAICSPMRTWQRVCRASRNSQQRVARVLGIRTNLHTQPSGITQNS
jgi:GT2 family glycosyltransferase